MKNTLIWLQEMEDNNESWVNISSVITMLKKEQEETINYTVCCESDSEQLKFFLKEIEGDKSYIHSQYFKNKAKTLRKRL